VSSFIPPEWVKSFPPEFRFVLLGATIVFMAFQILYPFCGIRRRIGFPPMGKIFKEAALAIPFTIGTLIIVGMVNQIWLELAPDTSMTTPMWESMTRSNEYVWIAIVMCMATTIGPIAEEIFFRGYLLNAFRSRFGLVAAMIVSSMIFAIVHSYSAAPTVSVFLMGICFAGVYHSRKTLLTPIFMHILINIAAVSSMLIMMHVYANTPVLGITGKVHGDGVLITLVAGDSGAEHAEIQVGDILTEVDGKPVKSVQEMVLILYTRKVGDVVKVTLIRDNTTIDKSVSLGPKSSGAEKALTPTTQSSD